MPPTVLLTGVTGFVGSEILYELLLRTRAQVICLVRAESDAEAVDRLRAVVARLLGEHGWETVCGRLTVLRGDLTQRRLGLDMGTLAQLVERTTHIVHGAASVRFGLPLAKARAVNVGGTTEMLQLADACMRHGVLQRFGYVSTAFVAGRHPGVFAEDDLERRQSFRNTYERTKYEAEQMVRWHEDLPTTVVRPAVVVGDSRSGATRGFNVVYWPLRLYADGVFRYAPTRPDLPVDLVPVDYVARGTVEAVLGGGRAAMTYTLAAGPRATTAGAIAAVASQVFDVAPPFMMATPLDRMVMPLAVRLAVVGPWSRYAKSLREYMPYFLQGSRFDTRNAEALLGPLGVSAPSVEAYLRPILEFARETDFGRDREAIARREAEVAAERLGALRAARSGRGGAARRRVPVGVG
jgi:thioester reductase-like protein